MGEIPARDKIEQAEMAKVEHLIEGVRPIMVCVGNYQQYGEEISEIENIINTGRNIKYGSNVGELNESDFKNAGKGTYVISSIDSKPKFTERLCDCTSLIAVGQEIGSKSELSILTHQDPQKFLHDVNHFFVEDLKERLDELKKRCLKGSIDIIIAGGYYKGGETDEYRKSLEVLNSIVQDMFGFKPSVIPGPENFREDNIYFDTANRRLYAIRPESIAQSNAPISRHIIKTKNK